LPARPPVPRKKECFPFSRFATVRSSGSISLLHMRSRVRPEPCRTPII
jgi:hypothetical protein